MVWLGKHVRMKLNQWSLDDYNPRSSGCRNKGRPRIQWMDIMMSKLPRLDEVRITYLAHGWKLKFVPIHNGKCGPQVITYMGIHNRIESVGINIFLTDLPYSFVSHRNTVIQLMLCYIIFIVMPRMNLTLAAYFN